MAPSNPRRAEPAARPDAGAPPARPATRSADRTRAGILEAATAEFVAHGLSGASVNEIAARAGANKRMIYHYFGNKENLYLAVLEATYARIRSAERTLELAHLPPREAVERLVRFTWGHFVEHPEFLALLNIENMQEARHLRRSTHVREMHSPLIDLLRGVLARGAVDGTLREGVEAVDLYVSIAALCWFPLSNRHTLGVIFDRDPADPEAMRRRTDHAVAVVMGYLRPDPGVRRDAAVDSATSRHLP